MENFKENINLLKLIDSEIVESKGVQYLAIPVEKNNIYISTDKETGQVRGAYLGLLMWESPNNLYGNSHLIKQDFSKEYLEANPEKAKNSPILGNARIVIKNANNGNSSSNGIIYPKNQEMPAQPMKQYQKPERVYNEPHTSMDDLPY